MLSDADISDLFAAFGTVRRRRMFGGAGLYHDGLMFAVETRDGLFLKTDAQFALELAERGAQQFRYYAKGREVGLNFWSVPDAALDAPDDLAALTRRSLSIARMSAQKAAGRARKTPNKNPGSLRGL